MPSFSRFRFLFIFFSSRIQVCWTSFIADKYPVLGPLEEYPAELGFTDERIHFLKQACAASSHLFIVDNYVKERYSPGR